MTIKEWKEKFMKLHEDMKKDLEAKTLEIYIEEETLDSYPCLNPISRTKIKIIAK